MLYFLLYLFASLLSFITGCYMTRKQAEAAKHGHVMRWAWIEAAGALLLGGAYAFQYYIFKEFPMSYAYCTAVAYGFGKLLSVVHRRLSCGTRPLLDPPKSTAA